MQETTYQQIFTRQLLDDIFPPSRADLFFDALYGDVSEGAYDIALAYVGEAEDRIHFEFQLKQRSGKCLACHLTYGLPEVFMRHPVIDVVGVSKMICDHVDEKHRCADWSLGRTREVAGSLHVLPFTIKLVPR